MMRNNCQVIFLVANFRANKIKIAVFSTQKLPRKVMEPQNTKIESPDKSEKEILPPPPRKNRRKLKFLFIGAATLTVLVVVVFYYFICVVPYESTDDAFIDGYVTLVSPRVPGQITQLLVKDNQEVKAGDVLVEIDPRDYEAKAAQARADLTAAQSQLNESQAQVKVSEAKVTQTQAAVTAAEAENQRATDDLKRYENVESRAISKSAFDLAQAQARAAAANLDAARSQTNAAESDVELSEAGVETVKAAVQQAEAKLQQAELNLSYTKIIAPLDARATARTVQLGNYVQPGQALLALVPKDVWVVANFKETQLTHMKPGQPVQLSVDAYPNKKFKGKVDSLQAGTGARFSLLPPENAVGNYIKVVQRIPVKIIFDEELPTNLDIAPGMSVVPIVKVK
jgi:membrane fusion protein (multidrug efflux system)